MRLFDESVATEAFEGLVDHLRAAFGHPELGERCGDPSQSLFVRQSSSERSNEVARRVISSAAASVSTSRSARTLSMAGWSIRCAPNARRNRQ